MADSKLNSYRLGSDQQCQQEQTTGFVDGAKSWMGTVDSNPDPTFSQAASADVDLANFLSRPLKIAELEMSVGGGISSDLDVWELYFSNGAVQDKIRNYFLIRCKMMIKVVVSSSPFLYSRLLVSYNPFPSYDDTAVVTGEDFISQKSQRPNVQIDVAENTGGCLCLPFFHYNNALRIPVIGDFQEMGTVSIDSFINLASANGGTGNITISVFAWAVDVELSAPTVSFPFTPQGGDDEYSGDGVVSKPATAIAEAAGMLSVVPILRPFAMATQIGASAVASIARIFGYSRPLVLDKPHFVRNYVYSNMASTDIGEPINSLAVDSKNEITVDPRTVGLSDADEMTIEAIAKKETYLSATPWNVGSPPDSFIFSALVSPMIARSAVVVTPYSATTTQVIPTALSFATTPFKCWTGTINFRFQVVASRYHRGRLRIVYDPHSFTGAEDTFGYDVGNRIFNKIIDITEERDVVISVPWCQNKPFLDTTGIDYGTDTLYRNGDATVAMASHIGVQANGIIGVQILNELNGPADVGAIYVLVSISAGDDFKLAVPTSENIARTNTNSANQLTYFEPQGGEDEIMPILESPDADATYTLNPTQSPIDSNIFQAFFGETIMSFRTLLKRYAYYQFFGWNLATSTTTMYHVFHRERILPNTYGDDTTSPQTLMGNPFNSVPMNFITYLKPAYAAWRGSIRYKISPLEIERNMCTLYATRSPREGTPETAATQLNKSSGTSSSEAVVNIQLRRYTNGVGFDGAAATSVHTQEGLEVEFPYYLPFRFSHGRVMSSDPSTLTPAIDIERWSSNMQIGYTTDAVDTQATGLSGVHTAVAVGDDFSFFFYVNAPAFYFRSDAIPS